MKLRKPAAILAFAALLLVGLPAPAQAQSASSITIYSPSGVEVDSGVSVAVTGYNASGDYTDISLWCDQYSDYLYVPPGDFSVSIGPLEGPDTCYLSDYYTSEQLATFTVAGPVTTVSKPSVDKDAFYPLVRDDYRDTVTFAWRQSDYGRATIDVVNSNGKAVRTARPSASQGRNTWAWNGKSNDGDLVKQGRYRLKVRVNHNSVSVPVTVKSEVVTKTFYQRREGHQAPAFRTGGNCYASRDSYNEVADLDCWGGRFARATYRMTVPANAYDVRGTIDLLRTDADICCQGRITKGWSKSKRTVTFWAQVTGWRATEVNFVRVAYKSRVRI